ncbi:MAG: branched-chain amino acid ABC transporter permease [Tissierellia bacterium]|nr:branched-chain amino acid ABC transporter permease [Tissierellia bacterium]
MEKKVVLKNIGLILLVFLIAKIGDRFLNIYLRNILNLAGIYVILALSLNLINGFTGLFSLGHAGFMAIGAYVTAIFIMPQAVKDQNFFTVPMMDFLYHLQAPLPVALVISGILAALFGFIIAFPVLRLRDDYLAIASLGFAEIIRIFILNMPSVTNAALGLTAIPRPTTMAWTWVIAAITFVLLSMLIRSSYGKAIIAIREDEVAAVSMGVRVFRTKLISFCVGSFFAGVGGGLLATHMGTIDAKTFTFTLTFNILLMVVLGGMGSLKGSVIAALIITYGQEWLRFLDEPISIGSLHMPAMPGLRMVVFSLLLMFVVIFKKEDNSFRKNIRKAGGTIAKGE